MANGARFKEMSRIKDDLDYLRERDLISAEDHGYGLGYKDGREEMRNEMQDELEALRSEADSMTEKLVNCGRCYNQLREMLVSIADEIRTGDASLPRMLRLTLQSVLDANPIVYIDGVRVKANEPMYEDELPPDMSDIEYDEWFSHSEVVDGVRVGPRAIKVSVSLCEACYKRNVSR